MTIIFPIECSTDASRMAWCYRAQEKLRIVHNSVGKWYKSGLTQNQYDQLPAKVKNRYTYVPELSESDWKDFQENVFEKISAAITAGLLVARNESKESTYWEPDLDGDIN